MLAQFIPVDEGNTNQSIGSAIFPDFLVWETLGGVNRKTTSEILGGLDKVEDQLLRELAGPIETLALIEEGHMRPAADGGSWAYQFNWSSLHTFPRTDEAGTISFTRRHYRTPWKAVKSWEQSLQAQGVMIMHSTDLYDTCTQLIALHDWMLKGGEHKTLHRLIKSSHTVQGLTIQETRFARQLMAFDGVGEEAALTIAASFGNIMELIECWAGNGTIADLMMRSGTRRVGNALERKLQSAIGWSASIPHGLPILQT